MTCAVIIDCYISKGRGTGQREVPSRGPTMAFNVLYALCVLICVIYQVNGQCALNNCLCDGDLVIVNYLKNNYII
jgi:hypothetical protein